MDQQVVCFYRCMHRRDVYGVQQLANAVDKSQMILLRANFLSKCNFPENQVIVTASSLCAHTQAFCTAALTCHVCWLAPVQGLAVCSPAQRAIYLSKSISNVAAMQTYHEGVFLGERLEAFRIAA